MVDFLFQADGNMEELRFGIRRLYHGGSSLALPLKLWEFGLVTFGGRSPAPGGPAGHLDPRRRLTEVCGVLSATPPSTKQKRAAANRR